MLEKMKIAVVGFGVMGRAIVSSLIGTGRVGRNSLTVVEPNPERLEMLKAEFNINGALDSAGSINQADIVILAIKPQGLNLAAKSIKGNIREDALVISILAGVSLDTLREKIGVQQIIRAMPNTPAQIGMGVTVWVKTEQVNEEKQKIATEIIQTLGEEVMVDEENYLDMATALSGTGPAYVFLFMEAMIEAGVHMGFPRRIAEKLVVQTLRGSTEFYRQNHEHPARLRNDVTSPGGTTAEALYYLEKAGFRTAISRAIWAAYERSIELGKGKAKKVVEELNKSE